MLVTTETGQPASIFDLPGCSHNQRMAWIGRSLVQEALDDSIDIDTTHPESLAKYYADGATEHPIQLLARITTHNQQKARITEQQVVHQLCHIYQLEYGEPEQLAPLKETASLEYQRHWHFYIAGHKDNTLIVLASEPYSRYYWQPHLERIYGLAIALHLLEPRLITEQLDKIDSSREIEVKGIASHTIDLTRLLNIDETGEEGKERSAEQISRWLLNQAFDQHASDIHLETRRTDLLIRYRVDGILSDYATLPQYTGQQLVNRMKVISGLDITESRLPQDGRMTISKETDVQEIRVSSMPLITGEKLVLRIFDPDALYQPLSDIFTDQQQLDLWRLLISNNQGLILVTGPTGSGKTTTLYSTMAQLHSPRINICTVENPVEMIDQRFNQVQVNTRIGMTFSRALQNLLRQDPDVIMIGEIRDEETATIAVQAALTGHLVLATLHTNDALSAIHRMGNLGIPSYLLQSTLKGVLAQRLARLICRDCKGNQCPNCRHTGYQYRQALFELIAIDPDIREQLAATNQKDLLSIVRQSGYPSLLDAGQKLVSQQLTDTAEIYRVCPLETAATNTS